MALFLSCLEYILEEGPRWDWFGDGTIRACACVSGVSGGLFLWRSLTYAHPVVDLRALRSRNFSLGCFFSFATGVGLFSTIYLTPLFLARVRGFDAWQTGSTVFSTGLFRRIDLRWLMFGLACMGLGLWLYTPITHDWGWRELLLPQAFHGFAQQFAVAPTVTLTLGGLAPERLKPASGLFNLMRNLGGAIIGHRPGDSLRRAAPGERRHEQRRRVPWKQDPRVLLHLGHIRLRHRPPGRLRVEAREVRPRQHLAHDAGGDAAVHQVVDDQEALAVAGRRRVLEDGRLAEHLLVVGSDRDALDEAALKLACDDGGGDQAAAGDGDDAPKRAERHEQPGERPRVAVQLVPRDGRVVSGGGAQNSRPPLGTAWSGATSTTSPSTSGIPRVRTSLRNGPIWRGGKFTTAQTWRPTRRSGA